MMRKNRETLREYPIRRRKKFVGIPYPLRTGRELQLFRSWKKNGTITKPFRTNRGIIWNSYP